MTEKDVKEKKRRQIKKEKAEKKEEEEKKKKKEQQKKKQKKQKEEEEEEEKDIPRISEDRNVNGRVIWHSCIPIEDKRSIQILLLHQ